MLRRKFLPIIFIFLTIISISIKTAKTAEHTLIQLTNNSYDDYMPQISNGQVIWEGWDGTDYEIFFYDGFRTIQLTNNNYTDWSPQIHNGQVVWNGYDGNDDEIFLYTSGQTIQLSRNSDTHGPPQIHNGQVVWDGYDGNDYEIFLYDGNQTIQLTNNSYDDCLPQIHNGQIVWGGFDGSDDEIFLYTSGQIIQLTNNSHSDSWPQIHNGQVAWDGYDGNDAEIFLYTGNNIVQLTNNSDNDYWPKISDGQVAWERNEGEAFFFDGTSTIILNDYLHCYTSYRPRIANGQVVWWGSDGNDAEIFFYANSQIIQLTNNNHPDTDPQIDNKQIVWASYGENDSEIFLATPSPIEILDGSEFSAGRKISSNPQVLASDGTMVDGAVTDGVTRLLLKLNVNSSQAVTFSLQDTGNKEEDGILRSIDGLQQGSSITVNTAEVNAKRYAFAVYQAPENFVRTDYQEEDKKTAERILPIKVTPSSGLPIERNIKLVRPPLILVHGIWSGPEMWNEFEAMLKNRIQGLQIYKIDYHDKNASHFMDNKNVPYSCEGDSILKAKSDFRSQKIAITQVDVVGYSMGGLLAKIYAASDKFYNDVNYKRNDNFLEGDINKLITVDTPHEGSFLAESSINCSRFTHSKSADTILKIMNKLGMSLTKGAAEDMMLSSEKIRTINKIEINPLCHSIVGDYTKAYLAAHTTPDGKTEFVIEGLPTIDIGYVLEFNPYNILNVLIREGHGDAIIFSIKNGSDLVVATYSQEGKLDSPHISLYGHYHTDAIGTDVTGRVVKLLNVCDKDDLFANGFPIENK